MLTIQELRSSTEKELLQELVAARKNTLKTRVNTKTKHEKDIAKVQKAKCYVAQILTVLKETEGKGENKLQKEASKKDSEINSVEKKSVAKPEGKEKEGKAK
ncbi:50S ribosomal protein L29 [Patescibacteria group bacterium]|nr:50S ribosomal protein L29 [Patescibacteria group bacterium]